MMCKAAKCTVAAACALRGGSRDAGAGGVWHRHVVIGRPLRRTRPDCHRDRLETRRPRPGYYTVTVAGNTPSQHSRVRAISFTIANVASIN